MRVPRDQSSAQAIDQHGGEAQDSRQNFVDLLDSEKTAIIAFLKTLRTPRNPSSDL